MVILDPMFLERTSIFFKLFLSRPVIKLTLPKTVPRGDVEGGGGRGQQQKGRVTNWNKWAAGHSGDLLRQSEDLLYRHEFVPSELP